MFLQGNSETAMKMQHSDPYFICKITTVLCYSRQFTCHETIVTNHKTVSAAILKFALPNICSRVVTFWFSFSGFLSLPEQFRVTITRVGFRLCSFSVNSKDLPRDKSVFCQISFKAEAQRCSLPLTWRGVFYLNHGL